MTVKPYGDAEKNQVIEDYKLLGKRFLRGLNTVGGSHAMGSTAVAELFATGLIRLGQRVWELGCGTGHLALYAAYHTGFEVLATDINITVYCQLTERLRVHQKKGSSSSCVKRKRAILEDDDYGSDDDDNSVQAQ